MNRPCFESHRRKALHSSMFYCIHGDAITPQEKCNLGDLDKIFRFNHRYSTRLTQPLKEPGDLL